MNTLTPLELGKLVRSVFPRLPNDKHLGILVDVPHAAADDNPSWKYRRAIAQEWALSLQSQCLDLGLEKVELIAYPSVSSNNADLPSHVFLTTTIPDSANDLSKDGVQIPLDSIFTTYQIFLAPTEYSTTAPLKISAKKYPFRAATMPGFCASMIPALKLDYKEIGRRVGILKQKLDIAKLAHIYFTVSGTQHYYVQLDLEFRVGHASAGCFPNTGEVGNLPSGEAYIVPHEGEKGHSKSHGMLPVQLGEEVVIYEIQQNKAIAVIGNGSIAEAERHKIESEKAYANIAELGLGVLADLGVSPIGEILLDEKLGLHIAFGRSDHFGGMIGPSQFSSPKAVIHIDRIYIPALQPAISVDEVCFAYENGKCETIMKDGKYIGIF